MMMYLGCLGEVMERMRTRGTEVGKGGRGAFFGELRRTCTAPEAYFAWPVTRPGCCWSDIFWLGTDWFGWLFPGRFGGVRERWSFEVVFRFWIFG